MANILLISLLVLFTIIVVTLYIVRKNSNKKNAKVFMGLNLISVFGALVCITVILISSSAAAAPETVESADSGLKYVAAALSTGLASIGAGIAVAISSSAALGAISEDEKLLGKTLIFVGLSEGIAIYGLIVTILILYG